MFWKNVDSDRQDHLGKKDHAFIGVQHNSLLFKQDSFSEPKTINPKVRSEENHMEYIRVTKEKPDFVFCPLRRRGPILLTQNT